MKTKNFVLFIGLLLTLINLNSVFASTQTDPEPAPLPDDSLSFCRQQKWAKTCLNTLLTYRCNQYYFWDQPLEFQLCSASAQMMIDSLDYKTVQVINDNKIYRFKIIFSKTLRSLVKNRTVQTYLRSLAIDLKKAKNLRKPFDLYQYTLKYAKTKDTAIQWLAILFQDTTFSQVQVTYLEELAAQGNLNKEELQAKESMKEIATLLEPKELSKQNFQGWLKLYPTLPGNNFSSYLNASFYHFYPMALLANILSKNKLTKNYAFLIPFVLNSDYEFQTLDSDRWPWMHPAPFKITPSLDWKMRDLYTGLVGSLYGANREELTPPLKSFTKSFAAYPFKTMKEWAHKK